MRLIGIDVGTTGCKVALFDESGSLIISRNREYDILIPYQNWAEQDVERVWFLIQDALREVIAYHTEDATCGEDIGAVGLSVQGEAVLPVDASGTPLRNAILGMDTRTRHQNDLLRSHIGARALFDHTGMPVHTINTLPKLMWLKANEPNIWNRAHKFLLYEDFFIKKLTGQAVISSCLASRTQLYDAETQAWSTKLMSYLDLDPNRLSSIHPSGTVVDRMLPDVAAALGFSIPPLVVTGGHDQACGALGVGLTQPGQAMVSTGSAEVVEVVLSAPILNTVLYEGNLSVYTHTVPGQYLTMTLNHSGGLVLKWFRDTLGQLEVLQAEKSGKDAYDILLNNASSEPSGLLMLPHFAGSGTPVFDTASKGVIVGLTFATSKAELAKAVLEGLTYELKLNLELLKKGGVTIHELRAIGGGAKSPLWLQMKADITGIPVVVPRVIEAACWGAALLAGAGAGCYASISEAAERSVVMKKSYLPDPIQSQGYAALYDVYKTLYPTLKSVLHNL